MPRNMTQRKLRRRWGRHSSSWAIIRQIAECDSQATTAAKNATCPFRVNRSVLRCPDDFRSTRIGRHPWGPAGGLNLESLPDSARRS
jgi:hypothetical protein